MLVVFLKIRNVGSGGYRKEDGRSLENVISSTSLPPTLPGLGKSRSGSPFSGAPDTYSHWEPKRKSL